MVAHDVSHYDALVIGAGINGLTAAASLGQTERRVLVLERRDRIGGVAATEEIAPGCRVSPCGPDVGWIPPQVVDALRLTEHGLEWLSGAREVALARSDGSWLELSPDEARTAEALRRYAPADAARWPTFVDRMTRLAGFLETLSLSPPPRPTLRLRGTSMAEALQRLRVGLDLRRMGSKAMLDLPRTIPMPVADLLDDWFGEPSLKGALAGAAVAEALQGPRSPGTAFLLLHRLIGSSPATLFSRARIRGGPGGFVAALASACRGAGVEIRCGAEVAAIDVSDGRCRGVRLADGRTIGARTVLSSADPRRTLLDLVGAWRLDPEIVRALQHIRYRGASARVTLLVDTLPVRRGVSAQSHGATGPHATGPRAIIIGPTMDDVERAYDAAKYGEISAAPYLEVTIPSVDDPSLCPAGQHVLSVLAQYTPYHLADGCWDTSRRDALGQLVIAQLERYLPGLERAILAQRVLTPYDLETIYGLPEGSLAYGEMALDQILFMRPVAGLAAYRTPIDGLYLCGTGTHPGRGIAGGSGRLAAHAVVKDGR